MYATCVDATVGVSCPLWASDYLVLDLTAQAIRQVQAGKRVRVQVHSQALGYLSECVYATIMANLFFQALINKRGAFAWAIKRHGCEGTYAALHSHRQIWGSQVPIRIS